MIERIGLLIAMEEEALPVARWLGLAPAEVESAGRVGLPCWRGEVEGTGGEVGEVLLMSLGVDERFGVANIGPVPATLAAHVLIEEFGPDLLVSAGTCGGFVGRGGEIGKVYLSEGPVVFHDRRVQIPGFAEAGVGSLACLDVAGLARELGLALGRVSTGSSLDCPADDAAALHSFGAACKDMEAAAVAWVAMRHGVPFVAVKGVTDLVDGPRATPEEFLEHLHVASEAVAEATGRVVRSCVGRGAGSLGG